MAERTRAATYEDVHRIAELLGRERVEYALIGGYALALQGIVRLTEDIDILVRPTPENARRWVKALGQLPDGAANELEGDETLHEEPYAIRINDEFTIDVMNSASGFTWDELAPYRKEIEGVQVVSLEGLLRMKERGRLKDLADAEAIRKALGLANP
ncbi:MAG TPA: hypothetical protein VF765_23770 [Polyangiaceae bacterium]